MDRQKLRDRIQQELILTREKVLELKELTKPIAPENAIGRVSRMDAINNKSVNEMALRQAEFKLRKLQIALEKVDEPSFGKCGRCGSTIQEGRLMLLPENTLCIRCAAR
ncbi:TraR/DksA C4-type zinc finger protein [bacterium SCSIO 12741]|nr:TraR/DksA C4-type zinc finger protein [bacterium SCSIO 12741]